MFNTKSKLGLAALGILLSTNFVQAQSAKVFDIDVKKETSTIQPNMWGIFFEDINMGADGGIYAELIKNRSFEFYKPLMGWKREGKGYKMIKAETTGSYGHTIFPSCKYHCLRLQTLQKFVQKGVSIFLM